MQRATHRGPLLASGLLLGTGLGGFVDGIVLHQILQWHNMLSSVRPPTTLVDMKINMVWDGLFHAFTWIVTAVGLGLLWRAGRREDVPWSGRTFVGAMLAVLSRAGEDETLWREALGVGCAVGTRAVTAMGAVEAVRAPWPEAVTRALAKDPIGA
jgi:hypothetical protein